MSNAVSGTATRHESSANERRVWMLAYLTLALGALAALTSLWRSAHLVGLVVGLISLLTGAYAQMLSTHTNQRWFAVVGAIAGGFGAAMGAAHGGW